MRILFLGAPGAGKGTQCKRLSKHLDIVHLSSGDLLRKAVFCSTAVGVKAKSYMNKGQLVPDNVLIAMFEEALVKPEYAKGFILDGFPRNLAQAKCLDELLEKLNCKLTVVINMQVDRSLLVERICGRRTCSNQKCSATYHIKFMPPNIDDVCDLCGSPLVRRSDDTEDVVQKRLEIYDRETAPLIEYYDNCLLLRTIDGDGDVDEIFADVLRTIKVLT